MKIGDRVLCGPEKRPGIVRDLSVFAGDGCASVYIELENGPKVWWSEICVEVVGDSERSSGSVR